MISVFRRLRRSFLFQNRITRYLIYAFGEIILVMVGILLAIQVNDYRQDKEKERKEQFYLASLKADIDSALVEMDRVINETRADAQGIETVMRIMAGDTAISPPDSVVRFIYGSNYTHAALTDGTITEITSSGNLEIIANDTLRRFIVNWSKRIDWMRSFEGLVENDYLDNRIYLQKFDDLPTLFIKDVPYPEERLRRILADTEFRNKITVYSVDQFGLLRTYLEYQVMFVRFSEQLERELN